MSKDHYVPETYLKHFEFENSRKEKKIWRYIKGSKHPSQPKEVSKSSICFEENGDTNPYFKKPRLLDPYFHFLENNYNDVINKLENNLGTDGEDKLFLALFIARMCHWTPVRKALNNEGYESLIKQIFNHPGIQEVLSNCSQDDKVNVEEMKKVLSDPGVQLKVDRNHSDADIIRNLNFIKTGLYYHQMPWTIIRNDSSKPFITCDNPVCRLEVLPDQQYRHVNTYVPLTPKLAVFIHLVPQLAGNKSNWGIVKEDSAVQILNSQIAKFAHKHIISNINEEWISDLIQQHSHEQERCYVEQVQQEKDNKGNLEIFWKVSFKVDDKG